MKIYTWNANNKGRWENLAADPLFKDFTKWDLIFLQEMGNPEDGWERIDGPEWDPDPRKRVTNESGVIRYFRWKVDAAHQVFVTHCEWANHQKNHVAILTKSRPNWAAVLGGDQSTRPVFGIRCRLTWQNGSLDALFGCVHLIAASSSAPSEFKDIVPFVEAMRRHKKCDGWVLVGDFNCREDALLHEAHKALPTCCASAPPFYTLKSNKEYAVDYLVASNPRIVYCGHAEWQPGQAESDHRSAYCDLFGGPRVTVL